MLLEIKFQVHTGEVNSLLSDGDDVRSIGETIPLARPKDRKQSFYNRTKTTSAVGAGEPVFELYQDQAR